MRNLKNVYFNMYTFFGKRGCLYPPPSVLLNVGQASSLHDAVNSRILIVKFLNNTVDNFQPEYRKNADTPLSKNFQTIPEDFVIFYSLVIHFEYKSPKYYLQALKSICRTF